VAILGRKMETCVSPGAVPPTPEHCAVDAVTVANPSHALAAASAEPGREANAKHPAATAANRAYNVFASVVLAISLFSCIGSIS